MNKNDVAAPKEKNETGSLPDDSKESLLQHLKSVVLSIEWEISDTNIGQFIADVERLMGFFDSKTNPGLFLYILLNIGKHIRDQKAQANPEVVRLFHSAYNKFENIVNSQDSDNVDHKKYIQEAIDEFKKLKKNIRSKSVEKQNGLKNNAAGFEETETEQISGSPENGSAERMDENSAATDRSGRISEEAFLNALEERDSSIEESEEIYPEEENDTPHVAPIKESVLSTAGEDEEEAEEKAEEESPEEDLFQESVFNEEAEARETRDEQEPQLGETAEEETSSEERDGFEKARPGATKFCPHCAEEIKIQAVVCKHCHQKIVTGPKQKKGKYERIRVKVQEKIYNGDIFIPDSFERLIDVVNDERKFILLTDAEEATGVPVVKVGYIALNKNVVEWVTFFEQDSTGADTSHSADLS